MVNRVFDHLLVIMFENQYRGYVMRTRASQLLRSIKNQEKIQRRQWQAVNELSKSHGMGIGQFTIVFLGRILSTWNRLLNTSSYQNLNLVIGE